MNLTSNDIQSAQLTFDTQTNKLQIQITKTNQTTMNLEIPEPKDSIFNTMINLIKMSITSTGDDKEQHSPEQIFEKELTPEEYKHALQLEEINNMNWSNASNEQDESVTVRSITESVKEPISQSSHYY